MQIPAKTRLLPIVAILLLPLPSHAKGVDIGAIINGVINGVTQWVSSVMVPTMIDPLVRGHAATIQAQMQAQTAAIKSTNEAVVTYQEQRLLERDAATLQDKMQQPANTCGAMAMADNVRQASQMVDEHAAASTRQAVRNLEKLRSTDERLAQAATTATRYCTEDDIVRGRHGCRGRDAGRMAGGDRNAAFLFGSPDGGSVTYEPGQEEAVAAMIDRIAGNLPPENLQNPDWEKTRQGQAYLEMSRRYAAINSMVHYSLHQIRAAHVSQAGLADRTGTTAEVGGKDTSIMGALKAFIESKFSSASIANNAQARSAEAVLRDLAQMQAFKLYMDYQNMRQMERVESVLATNLALQSQQVMEPQMQAQIKAAASAAGYSEPAKPVKR